MPKLEIKKKAELSRKEVAERLIALGRALANDSEVELGSSGESITVVVADQVRWELEIEVDGDETEIEIEISWRDGPAAEPSDEETGDEETGPATPAKPVRRSRTRKSTAG